MNLPGSLDGVIEKVSSDSICGLTKPVYVLGFTLTNNKGTYEAYLAVHDNQSQTKMKERLSEGTRIKLYDARRNWHMPWGDVVYYRNIRVFKT